MHLQHVDDWAAFDGTTGKGGRAGGTVAPGSEGATGRAGKPRVVSRGLKWHEYTEAEERFGDDWKLECPRMPRRLERQGVEPGEWQQHWQEENSQELTERQDCSRTASNCVGVHWLAGSLPHDLRGVVRSILREYFGPSMSADHSFNGYTHGEHWGGYASLLWVGDVTSPAFKRQGETCFVSITGKGCDAIVDAWKLFDLMRRLSHLGIKWTRIDTFFDDFTKRVSPEDVERDIKSGKISVSGFKKMHCANDYDLGLGQYDGNGVRFGSRGKTGGGKMLRFYRKDLESSGSRDCYRWEVEFTKEHAVAVGAVLVVAADLADLCTAVGGAVGGVISFREPKESSDRHVERRAVIDWWSTIIEEIGSLPFRIGRKDSTVGTAFRYLRRCASGPLALVRQYCDMISAPFIFDQMIAAMSSRPLRPSQVYALERGDPMCDEVLDLLNSPV